MHATYDEIGLHYTATRQQDPRLAATIWSALGEYESVVNVGAGAGGYEPEDKLVFAVEPSAIMIQQRTQRQTLNIQGTAEMLPIGTNAVDTSLAILTIHHWRNPQQGLAEMCRVARRRVVVFTWDQEVWESFWLNEEYFPHTVEVDRARAVPINAVVSALGACEIKKVPIPIDCIDGFHGAFWARPSAYLDPRIRSGISTFALMDSEAIAEGLFKLQADLQSGAWEARHQHLRELESLDLGYRLIVSTDT